LIQIHQIREEKLLAIEAVPSVLESSNDTETFDNNWQIKSVENNKQRIMESVNSELHHRSRLLSSGNGGQASSQVQDAMIPATASAISHT